MATNTVMVYDKFGVLRMILSAFLGFMLGIAIYTVFVQLVFSKGLTEGDPLLSVLIFVIMMILIFVFTMLGLILGMRTAKKIIVVPLFFVSQQPNYWDSPLGTHVLSAGFGLAGLAFREFLKAKKFMLCKEGLVQDIYYGLKLTRWNKFKKYTVDPANFEFNLSIAGRLLVLYSKENFDEINRLFSENIPS